MAHDFPFLQGARDRRRSEGLRRLLRDNPRPPARSDRGSLEALDAAIATISDESDPTQVIRIGVAASYVDRLEGCRAALWHIVDEAREGRAVAAGILARIQLASSGLQTGRWDEAEALTNEAIEAIVRYLVHPKEAGRVKTRLIQTMLARLNAEPERTLFPKSNMR